MATVLPTETPQYAFADITELNRGLTSGAIPPGSAILAGKNFGCGSSREQAVSTLKGYDLVIIARGFARIFLQNAVNLGLRTIVAPAFEGSIGDVLELHPTSIVNRTTNRTFDIVPHSPSRQALIDAGGLIAYTRAKVIERRSAL
jgi:3-isopropylmalate/(R)-2-methylmalate dehydratase small subunit